MDENRERGEVRDDADESEVRGALRQVGSI